jgi:hypothetical protein
MGNTFSDNENSDSENSDSENSDNENENLGVCDESGDVIDIGDDKIPLNIASFSNIKWVSDNLDINDEDLKITYNLEHLLHNYFLICDKSKIININIKKYSSVEKSKYCKLLLKIHKNIKENEDIIEDVIENFPFEYTSANFGDELSDDIDDITTSVINNIFRIIEFYKQVKYSKIYCLYNLLLEIDSPVGVSIKQVFDSINKNGICLEGECNDISQVPSTEAYRTARFRNQLKCYRVEQNINDLKDCLNQKKPIIFGISIYKSFYEYDHIELPKKKDKKIDDICMVLVGYDDEEREWLIKNDKVYRISFKYLLNKKLCKDFWYFEI